MERAKELEDRCSDIYHYNKKFRKEVKRLHFEENNDGTFNVYQRKENKKKVDMFDSIYVFHLLGENLTYEQAERFLHFGETKNLLTLLYEAVLTEAKIKKAEVTLPLTKQNMRLTVQQVLLEKIKGGSTQ